MNNEKNLALIQHFANSMCPSLENSGEMNSQEFSGDLHAGLGKLLESLPELQIKGAMKWGERKWKGVLQEHLVDALQNASDCRWRIFKELKDILLTKPSPPTSDTVLPPSSQPPSIP